MKRFCTLLFIFLLLPPLGAQEDGAFLFTTGTTWRDEHDRDWAWIRWMAPESLTLKNRAYAVFSKQGMAGDSTEFELQSIVTPQTDLRVIDMLLTRGNQLGGDADRLLADIESLFLDLNLDPSLQRAEKVLAVVLGSQNDPERYDNLVLLSQKHPALSMILGQAHAQIIPEWQTLFELRFFDPETGEAGAVMGRVLLNANEPRVLPKPTNLLEVEDSSPRGNLVVNLRWDEPAALKRLSLLQFGFNVYRMEATYALGKNYHITPPSPVMLASLLEEPEALVVQVNDLPVIINSDNPPGSAHFVDDNNRFAPGTTPLQDGDSYMYFVAARDQLGRIGLLSDGLLVQVCDRFPPRVPREVRVHRDRYQDPDTGEFKSRLKIIWRQNPDTPGDATQAYYVYKWQTANDLGFRGNDPDLNLFAGPIPHDPEERDTFIYDETVDGDIGSTFLYTVRAIDDASCGGNLSAHTGPAHGFVVDWIGPPVPAGFVEIRCLELEAKPEEPFTEPLGGFWYHPYRIRCAKGPEDTRVEWAEFRWHPGNVQPHMDFLEDAEPLGRVFFNDNLETTVFVPSPSKTPVTVYCRVGYDDRLTSDWVAVSFLNSQEDNRLVLDFSAFQELIWREPGQDCTTHEGIPPGLVGDEGPPEPGTDNPPGPRIFIQQADNATHWRLYRQINGGALTLVAQDNSLTGALVSLLNQEMVYPRQCSEISFYAQSFTDEGMSGELKLLARFTLALDPPPPPILSPIRAGGTAENPTMELHWISSPYVSDRFTVSIGTETPALDTVSPLLGTNELPPNTRDVFIVNGLAKTLYVGRYITGRVGHNIGEPGSSEFTLSVPVEIGQEVVVEIRARNDCASSHPSDSLRFLWAPPPPEVEGVPWPARPLPPVVSSVHPLLSAVWLENSPPDTGALELNRVGIRIGRYPYENNDPNNDLGNYFIFKNLNGSPKEFTWKTDLNDEELFPFVLYRRQVASAALPVVSGDLVQVSPMMEDIAYQVVENDVRLRDPFIVLVPDFSEDPDNWWNIHMMDTQPVIRGAAYQYYMVNFDERYEPKRVIQLNTVEIPE